jgi:predicted NBD/HSP70 family sugar kinase
MMRKINTRKVRRATRTTSREINRRIVLNLIRERQPISRADLARQMNTGRSMITAIVGDLLAQGAIWEGATANTPRGRKPTLLHLRSHDRLAVAVDVRLTRTQLALSDFDARPIAMESFDTALAPDELVAGLAERITRMLRMSGVSKCEGIGVVVPGMVDRRAGRVLNSPQLGWRNVDLREALSQATGLRVMIENAPTACALGYMWLQPRTLDGNDNFAYVAVSDGVGVGLVWNSEIVRGHAETAGEFGHMPIELDGVLCMCGLRGCWEAYTSNVATLSRYFGLDPADVAARERLRSSGFGVPHLVSLASAGDEPALSALRVTARYLGIGLAAIISTVNPGRIIVGGEITLAWDLIGDVVEAATRERALTDRAAQTPIAPAPEAERARLRGATALVLAGSFSAPHVMGI